MKLYFITAETESGYNFDLVVQAITIETAVKLWRDYYNAFDDIDDGNPIWDGEIFTSVIDEDEVTVAGQDDTARVWQIDNNLAAEGVVHWGAWTEIKPDPLFKAGQMTPVAYVPYR